MVNDHRTELKVGDVHRVMDGDLDELIQAYLKRRREPPRDRGAHSFVEEARRASSRGAGGAWA